MLDLGATSFWEDFDLSWTENAGRIDELVPEGRHDVHAEYGNYCYKGLRHSLCHGWAAGPTAWLSEHVLGVRPLEAGRRKVLLQPHLGDLDCVEGTYPTPQGIISMRHRRNARGEFQVMWRPHRELKCYLETRAANECSGSAWGREFGTPVALFASSCWRYAPG